MKSALTVHLEDGLLVFTELLPTLQQLASFNIAWPLWYSILTRENPDEDLANGPATFRDQISEGLQEVADVIEKLNVPPQIKKIIAASCDHVKSEILSWIFDTENYSLNSTLTDEIMDNSYLNYCVWKWNLDIDYETSARRIISHPDLNQVQKFKLMCRFCLQDEIESLSPDVGLQQFMENFTSEPDSINKNPVLYYWICRLKNNLSLILFSTDFSSVEMFMLCQHRDHNLASLEYFWNFLNKQDKITAAVKMIKNYFYLPGLKNLILSKLDEFQLSCVISEIPGTIMDGFLLQSNLEATRLVWHQVKNSINDNQFSTLMDDLLGGFRKKYSSFIIELWNSVDDRLKHNFLYSENGKKVNELFFHYQLGELNSFIDVLFAVLSYSSPTYRRNMVLENGDVLLIAYSNCSKVNKLIKFCLPNFNDIIQFKELVKNSPSIKEQYIEFFRAGQFRELITLLTSFFPGEPILKDHMKQILNEEESFEFDCFIFEPSEWSDFNKLLRVVYHNDKFSIKRIKQKLILSYKWSDDSDLDTEQLNHWRNAIKDLIDNMIELDGIINVIKKRV